ncbi:MAG: recombinase family protein, partial [Bacteroidota bacterium]
MPKFYAYIRRSNGTIDTENQRFDILQNSEAAELEKAGKLTWIEETVTGNSDHEDRQLGDIIAALSPGDALFVADVSRLGRRSLDTMEQGAKVMKRKARLICCRNNLELKDEIGSEVHYFALSLGARIERENIAARTRTALARKKAEGVILGRPKGSTS